jgi:hypothetical protein
MFDLEPEHEARRQELVSTWDEETLRRKWNSQNLDVMIKSFVMLAKADEDYMRRARERERKRVRNRRKKG